MKSIGLNLISIKTLCNYRDEKVVNVSESLDDIFLPGTFSILKGRKPTL
jgi:hypothetical protein